MQPITSAHGHLISDAVDFFDSLDVSVPANGDALFENYGGVLLNGDAILQPYERLRWYESLLGTLLARDPGKFGVLHKGLAYHFMAWCAYAAENYETSLHYLDNAIAEDIRNFPEQWSTQPASCFLRLDCEQQLVTTPIIKATRIVLDQAIDGYDARHGASNLTVDDLAKKLFDMVRPDTNRRSIVATIYVFCLEHERRRTELRLRSRGGGSISPFTIHLFRGCVCLESLLKCHYPQYDKLGKILKCGAFDKDFHLNLNNSSATSLKSAITTCAGPSIKQKFQGAAKLRNTLGHNLEWDDIFDDIRALDTAFDAVMDAIIHVVRIKH